METSYFAKSNNHPNAVCITVEPPRFYKGRTCKKLAPKEWFLKKYQYDHDEEFYTKKFYEEVLDKLDPAEVLKELGEDAILLCWEGKDKFCHRHLVAKWFFDTLGIEVKERE